jgi:DNA-binding FadR family transcriptional regulator
LVLAVFDLVHTARTLPVWGTLKQRSTTAGPRAAYQDQHRAIVEALQDRDPRTAETAMAAHLHAVSDALLRQ